MGSACGACPAHDRAGARKGLKWERGEGVRPDPRSRGCPCNCKRRARRTGPKRCGSATGVTWEGVHRALTREPGDLPAWVAQCQGPGKGRGTEGFRRATTKRLEPLRCRGRRHDATCGSPALVDRVRRIGRLRLRCRRAGRLPMMKFTTISLAGIDSGNAGLCREPPTASAATISSSPRRASSSRATRSARRSPIIDADTIEKRQTVDVVDLLATTPGVRFSRTGSTGSVAGYLLRGAGDDANAGADRRGEGQRSERHRRRL